MVLGEEALLLEQGCASDYLYLEVWKELIMIQESGRLRVGSSNKLTGDAGVVGLCNKHSTSWFRRE